MASKPPWQQPPYTVGSSEIPNYTRFKTYGNVTRQEHEELLQQYHWINTEYQEVQRKYANLRRALIAGGAGEDAIETLAQGHALPEIDGVANKPTENHGVSFAFSPTQDWDQDGWQDPTNDSKPVSDRPSNNYLRGGGQASWQQRSSSSGLTPSADGDRTTDWVETISRSKSPLKERHTILITNLPSDVTHKEITNIVRGGRLVEVWLRRAERTASVTFENATAAKNFVRFAQQMSFRLRGHKVGVSWSDRQFEINHQLRDKLSRGHSRNLVIRGAAESLSEEKIRNDMDHVHNLVITAIVTQGQDVYVSTNSVGGAQFAQTCMRSRREYRSFKIEWYPDECTDPLPELPKPSQVVPGSAAKPKPSPKPTVTNRFDLLNLDEDASGGSDNDSSSGVDIKPRSHATNS